MKTDAQKWEELALEAIEDAGYWKREARKLRDRLGEIRALTNKAEIPGEPTVRWLETCEHRIIRIGMITRRE